MEDQTLVMKALQHEKKPVRKAAAIKMKDSNKDAMRAAGEFYRVFVEHKPKGKKKAKELADKGVKLPEMDRQEGLIEIGKRVRKTGKRLYMDLRPKVRTRIEKLEKNDEFIKLLTSVDNKQAKDLMTTAMLESRMNPNASNSKSKVLGLFQQKEKYFSEETASKANKILKSIGSKKRLQKHSQLNDPVFALAYQLAGGRSKGGESVLEKYKLHQQEEAGMKRQKITSLAPDSAFMIWHAKGMKEAKQPPNKKGMQSVSDVDDLLAAIISNVPAGDKNKVKKLQDYIRKMWKTPQERMNTSAAEIDKKTFRAVQKAIEIYNKETAEHVKYSERAKKGAILDKAAKRRIKRSK